MTKDTTDKAIKVLVIDDEKDVKDLFKQRFRKEVRKGIIELSFAFSAEAALEILDAQDSPAFVLILSDINMPGMNGLELLEKIKERFPELKVFMITAYGDKEHFDHAMALGADDFINKPVDFKLLKAKVFEFQEKVAAEKQASSLEAPASQPTSSAEPVKKRSNTPKSETSPDTPEVVTPEILVVDDEPDLESLVRQKFRRSIRKKEIFFHFAHNGVEALEVLEKNPQIDLVISDINMPKMDGLTLIGKLHELSPILKSVIVSAYGDMDKIRTAMNKGAFDFLTKPINFDDLKLTINKTLEFVNQTKESLKSIQENNILKMYVDQSVIKFVRKKQQDHDVNKGENIEATVIFIDICSFTTISENHPPEQVFDLLNHYFDIIVFEIIEQGGVIDKFIGDAVMAVFRNDDHLRSCVRSALTIRQRIKALNSSLQQELGFSPDVSIGLHTGRMVAGNIGAKCVERYDFTVIGDAVNTAARIQGIAGAGDIIITDAIKQELGDEFAYEDRGLNSLKGKALPIQLFNVVTK